MGNVHVSEGKDYDILGKLRMQAIRSFIDVFYEKSRMYPSIDTGRTGNETEIKSSKNRREGYDQCFAEVKCVLMNYWLSKIPYNKCAKALHAGKVPSGTVLYGQLY